MGFVSNPQWMIALRFLFSLKGQRFLALLTLLGLMLATATVALSYTAVCVAESFSAELRRDLFLARPHLEITLSKKQGPPSIEAIAKDPRVLSVAPLVLGSALLQGLGRQEGVQVWGLENTEMVNAWSCIRMDGEAGTPAELFKGSDMILGGALLNEFYPALSEKRQLSLLYPLGDVDPFGNPVPIEQLLGVGGACESGVYPIDRKTVLIPADKARRLFSHDRGAWTEIWVFLKDPFSVEAFVEDWHDELGHWGEWKSWKESNKFLLGALKIERALIMGVLVLVFLLSSMTLYGVLSLLTIEKRQDFAVLYTLGLSESNFFAIILKMSAVLGGTTAVLGGFLGVLMVAILSRFSLPLPEAYYVEKLVVQEHYPILFLILTLAVLVQVAAALIPARWIKHSSPLESLRFVEGGVV